MRKFRRRATMAQIMSDLDRLIEDYDRGFVDDGYDEFDSCRTYCRDNCLPDYIEDDSSDLETVVYDDADYEPLEENFIGLGDHYGAMYEDKYSHSRHHMPIKTFKPDEEKELKKPTHRTMGYPGRSRMSHIYEEEIKKNTQTKTKSAAPKKEVDRKSMAFRNQELKNAIDKISSKDRKRFIEEMRKER